jgi:hypothetical protein
MNAPSRCLFLLLMSLAQLLQAQVAAVSEGHTASTSDGASVPQVNQAKPTQQHVRDVWRRQTLLQVAWRAAAANQFDVLQQAWALADVKVGAAPHLACAAGLILLQ